MSRARRCALVPVALLCALVALPAPVAGAQPARTVESAQEQARVLRAELADLRIEAARTVEAYEQAEHDVAEGLAASVRLSRRVEAAKARAAGSARQVDGRVAALYRSGGSAGLAATLLQSRDPADLVSRVAAINAVVRADAGVRRAAGQDSAALQELEERARTTVAARNRALAVLEQTEARLAANLVEQDRAVAEADAEVRRAVEEQRAAARAAAAARLAAAQRAAAERAAAARAAAARAAAAAAAAAVQAPSATTPASPGQLLGWTEGPFGGGPSYAGPPGACPVGPSHSFTDTWGAARVGHRHQGTDVFAPEGSPAYAVVDGVVDKVGNRGIGGISLWLRGVDGDRYYYAHNAANLVQVGQVVRAGQQVALVGRTGNAETTPAHIHFQAHPGGGSAVNPYAWLAALCAG